ncbi:MAG: amino acid permease [Acidobacteria bacterium]|nr:amino acid permease [Acidobacteriota bacterium]
MTPQSGLVRGLGLAAATSINIANMIGTGVFIKARVMTCNVETPLAVLGVWVAAGLLVLAGALTYAELAAMMPQAGGEYVFLREAYGRRWGFLYGWSYLLISRGGSLAAQAVSAAIFLNIVTGGAIGRDRLPLAACAAIALTTLVNCAAVSATGRIATALTAIKIAVVLAVGLAAFLLARGDWMHYALANSGGACEGVAQAARGGIAGFGAAMLGALWGFQGWANLTPMVGEVREPRRNIARAYGGAMLIVGALYLFANAGYFYALTPTAIAGVSTTSSVATEALAKFMGPATAGVMAMAMMISSLGALHSGMASTARVPYAMARDGLFFQGLARLSPSSVPVRGAVLIACWSGLLTLTGSYDKLTDWAIFALWLFYGLTAASVLVFRRRMPDAPRPYRVWGYPVVPAMFLLVTAWLLLNTLWTAPLQTLVSLALMLLGLPLYWYWGRRKVMGSK